MNKRLFWLLILFSLGAVLDVVFTIWNDYYEGYGQELNVLVHHFWVAILLKFVFVGLAWLVAIKLWNRSGEATKYLFVGSLVLLIFLQFWGAWSNIEGLKENNWYQQVRSGEQQVQITSQGDVVFLQNNVVVKEERGLSPNQKAKAYFGLMFFFYVLPLVFGTANFVLLRWVEK